MQKLYNQKLLRKHVYHAHKEHHIQEDKRRQNERRDAHGDGRDGQVAVRLARAQGGLIDPWQVSLQNSLLFYRISMIQRKPVSYVAFSGTS